MSMLELSSEGKDSTNILFDSSIFDIGLEDMVLEDMVAHTINDKDDNNDNSNNTLSTMSRAYGVVGDNNYHIKLYRPTLRLLDLDFGISLHDILFSKSNNKQEQLSISATTTIQQPLSSPFDSCHSVCTHHYQSKELMPHTLINTHLFDPMIVSNPSI
jgi:hypothetical protein